MTLTVETLSGAAARAYADDLAQLRIRVFAEWPYLYEGDMEYERKYVRTFFKAKHSVLVLAKDGDKVVGASTGLPLLRETANIKKPFRDRGDDLSGIFYFSESVLLPEYRGQGLGLAFFRERENQARLHGFKTAVFCSVVRPENHPLRPAGYVPLDAFWRKRGFEKMENTVCYISWKDHNESEESPKPLAFWQKVL